MGFEKIVLPACLALMVASAQGAPTPDEPCRVLADVLQGEEVVPDLRGCTEAELVEAVETLFVRAAGESAPLVGGDLNVQGVVGDNVEVHLYGVNGGGVGEIFVMLAGQLNGPNGILLVAADPTSDRTFEFGVSDPFHATFVQGISVDINSGTLGPVSVPSCGPNQVGVGSAVDPTWTGSPVPATFGSTWGDGVCIWIAI